jgi:hypothetical protein
MQNSRLAEGRTLNELAAHPQCCERIGVNINPRFFCDPPPSEERSYCNIVSETHPPIIDAFKKVVIIQGLIAAGATRTAHRWFPSETAAEDERILAEPRTMHFEAQGERWDGLAYELSFPVGLRVDNESRVTGCRMRFGVSVELLATLDAHKRTRGASQQVGTASGQNLTLATVGIFLSHFVS